MYENYEFEQAIFYYLYRFILPLIVAETITFTYAKKKMYWILRYICFTILFISLSAVFVYWNIDFKIGWFRTIFLIIFILSLFPLMMTYDIKLKQLLFLSLSAYAIQNFGDNFWQLLTKFLPLTSIKNWDIISLVLSYTVIYSCYFFVFIKLIKKNDVSNLSNNVVTLTSFIAILVVNILSMYAQQSKDDVGFISARIYAMIACFFILAVQYNIFHTRKLSNEKEILEQTLKFQDEKFNSSKETMELINIKCHDLKHAIEALKDTCSTPAQIERLNDLSVTVDIYDSKIKTDNPVLDMVLSEKSLVCKQNNIRLVPIIDGTLLSFMENNDVYSLFENALENAIKALKEEDEQYRSIFINIIKKNNATVIKIENYCSKGVEFEDGMPKSKQDNRFHGFGTKSIEYIAKKYNGQAVFNYKNNVFSLTICFFN